MFTVYSGNWDCAKIIAVSQCEEGVSKVKTPTPVAQMADIGFKVVLLERLNQKWKQKHF